MATFRKIKEIVAKIPKGKVTTYGEVAKALGNKDARIIGWALHGNKNASIPCYRVVNKNGRVTPSYAFGGEQTQKRKLEKEGVKFINKFQVDLKIHFWKPN